MSTPRRVITPDRKVIALNEDGTWENATPSGSALEKWKSLALSPNVIGLFKGLFEKLGVRIIDTTEELTCIHCGDRVEFVAGVDKDAVDFTAEIYAFQADRLAEHAASGDIDDLERFRIARALFIRSFTGRRNILSNPLMSNFILQRLVRGKNLIHVHLVSPDPQQDEDATFTLIYINKRWLVVPGLHGEPKRIFRVSVENAVGLQKQLFAGIKAGNWREWLKIAKWYVDWREKVEVRRKA